MDIKFLGTGGAFDYKLGNASALVTTADHAFLVDAGPTTYPALCELGLLEAFDYILITHLHGDHVGSLFQIIAHYNHILEAKPKLVYIDETHKGELLKFLALNYKSVDSVEFVPINEVAVVGALDITSQHVPDMPCYAYYFSEHDALIYYSGDLGVLDTTIQFLETRSEPIITVFHDINPSPFSGGHVSYKEAGERLVDYDVYGYHCDKNNMPRDNTIKLVQDHPEFLYQHYFNQIP